MSLDQERLPWKFEPNITFEHKAPRALEYIAHYLDRIDQSLERIADVMESGKVNEPVRAELRAIVAGLNMRR